MKKEKQYYIQDTRSYVGNSIVWWRQGNKGYSYNILEAKKFTESEMRQLINKSKDNELTFLKDYDKLSFLIDAFLKRKININTDESLSHRLACDKILKMYILS